MLQTVYAAAASHARAVIVKMQTDAILLKEIVAMMSTLSVGKDLFVMSGNASLFRQVEGQEEVDVTARILQ